MTAKCDVVDVETSTDDMKTETKEPDRKGERILVYAAYLFVGIVSLMGWNSVLFLTYHLCTQVLHVEDLSSKLLGCYHSGNILVQLVLVYIGSLRPNCLLLGGTINFIGITAMALVIAFANNAIPLLYMCCFTMGISSGVLQGAGFSIACRLPKNYIPALCGGQGLSGIISTLLSITFSFTIFDVTTATGTKGLSFSLCGITALLAICQVILAFLMNRISWVQEAIAKAKTNVSDVEAIEEGTPNVELLPSRPLKEVLKDAWQPLLSVFFSYFLSLNIFPKVGPIGWNINGDPKNSIIVLMSIFNVADFIGRLSPDFSHIKGFGWLMFPRKYILLPTMLRVLFYIPFFLAYCLKDIPVINDYWFLMIIMFAMQLSSGWVSTLSMMYCPQSVERNSERALICPLSVLVLISSILVGLYLSIAY